MPKRVAAFSPPRVKESPLLKEAFPRATAASRGYNSKQWYAIRKQALLRDNWQCRSCGRICANKREAQVDHIVPKKDGGLDELNNLQVLCIECHGRKTRNEQQLANRSKQQSRD